MLTYPLLMTLDFPDSAGPSCFEVHRADYVQADRFQDDRLEKCRPLQRGVQALAWTRGRQAELQPAGATQRVCPSPDREWLYTLAPQAAWPSPFQLFVERRGTPGRRLAWQEPGSEILALQAAPGGAYFVVQPGLGLPRLMFHDPLRRQTECVLRHPDLRLSEFAVAPDARSLIFVHSEDDQLYHMDFQARRLHQLSIPQLEEEAGSAPRTYRSSPCFSPDGQRVFYCTAYLELRDLELMGWGNAYVAPVQGGALRWLPLSDEGFPMNLIAPDSVAMETVEKKLALAS